MGTHANTPPEKARITPGSPGGRSAPHRVNAPSPSQFGLGFWQAWWTLALCSPTIIDDTRTIAGATPSTIVLTLTTLGYLVIVLAGMRGQTFSERRHSLVACSLLCGVGSLGMAPVTAGVLGMGAPADVTYLACTAVFALGNALLLTMWGELWSTLATGKVGRCLCTSYLFAIALYLVAAYLPAIARVALLVALPAISCAFLRWARREPRRSTGGAPHAGSPSPSLLARALVAAFALNLVWGLGMPLLGELDGISLDAALSSGQLGYVVALACLVCLLLYIMTARPEVEAFALHAPAICALAGGVLLSMALPPQLAFVGSGLGVFGGACLDNLVMLAATDLAFLTRRPVALTLGGALLVGRAGSLTGRMTYNMAAPLPDGLPETALLLCALIVVIVGCALFSSVQLRSLYQTPSPQALESTASEQDRCVLLAQAHGLTAREAEVLALLARGRSAPFIADELTLALGTVKNHISGIYRKVGVADRQGLLNAIEQADGREHHAE